MREIRVDDVIAKKQGSRMLRYRALGRTSRGKLRLLRLHTGTEMTTWWHDADRLPKGYYLEEPVKIDDLHVDPAYQREPRGGKR